MVCAVVCTAPLTMPSAIPRCTIMVPKYETSVTVSLATCTVMPLCARSLVYSSAKVATSSGSFGDTMRAPRDVDAGCQRLRPDQSFLAEQGQVGDLEPEQGGGGAQDPLVLALRQHHMPAIRPGPFEHPVLEHQRRHHIRIRRRRSRPAARRCPPIRRKPAARSPASRWSRRSAGPGPPASVDAVSKVPPGVTRIGRSCCTPSISCCTEVGRRVAAGQHDRRQVREGGRLVRQHQRRQHVVAVARRDHRVALPQPGEHVRQGHGGHHEAHRFLAAAASGSPRTSSAPQACCRFATVGATSSGISGIAAHRQPGPGQQGPDLLHVGGVDPVGDHRHRVRVPPDEFGDGQRRRWRRWSAGPGHGRARPAPPASRCSRRSGRSTAHSLPVVTSV